MSESVLVPRETLKHWLTLLDIAGDICPWGYDAVVLAICVFENLIAEDIDA